jgi:hypothetical protein
VMAMVSTLLLFGLALPYTSVAQEIPSLVVRVICFSKFLILSLSLSLTYGSFLIGLPPPETASLEVKVVVLSFF